MWDALKQRAADRLRKAINRSEERAAKARFDAVLEGCRTLGRDVHIYRPFKLTGGANAEIHDNVHIGTNAFIRAEGGLVIGENTHISRNLVLYTINHRTDGACLPYDDENIPRPVRIGRNVWIGMNVCITPGSEIGDGAIIGMGTVVAGAVPPLAVYVGAKGRIIGYRDKQHYEECESNGQYSGVNGRPLERSSGLHNANEIVARAQGTE